MEQFNPNRLYRLRMNYLDILEGALVYVTDIGDCAKYRPCPYWTSYTDSRRLLTVTTLEGKCHRVFDWRLEKV